MKLRKKLSVKQFVLSQMLILTAGLIFLAGLYYILNVQYQRPKSLFADGPITLPPRTLRLDLDQPDDNSLIFQPSVIVSGQTASFADILIYTDTRSLVIQSKADGSFSTVLDLDEGASRITAVVFDPKGDSKSAERTVYYSKEKI